MILVTVVVKSGYTSGIFDSKGGQHSLKYMHFKAVYVVKKLETLLQTDAPEEPRKYEKCFNTFQKTFVICFCIFQLDI